MASTGVKEYTLRINGVTQGLKDITTLEAAVKALDDAVKSANTTTSKATSVTKQKASALSDEEKAAKKLADTQKKIEKANSDANRAQIEATQQLRERTREVTRQVAAQNLAEGSIKAMGMQLTDLRNQYEALSAAERGEQAVGGALLEQIQSLDAEYKALRESTGNFRDSVGNYEKAFSGLNDLTDKFDLAARGSANMAASVAGSNEVLDAFGSTTTTVSQSTEQLAGVVALATTAQEAYNAVVKEGWLQAKAAAVMDGIRAVQLKAKTAAEALSTKGTIAATVAQAAFNVIANANPYVLLATALITVVGALYLFASKTETAAEKQKELNAVQTAFLDGLEAEGKKLKEVGDARVKSLENQLAVLQAAGAKAKDIRVIEDQLARARLDNANKQKGYYADEIKNLDANRYRLELLREELEKLKIAQARGEDKAYVDIQADGHVKKLDVEKAIDAVQGQIDNLNRQVTVGLTAKADVTDAEQQLKLLDAARAKDDADAAKERAKKAKETAKARADLELKATRDAEDARIALIDNSYERQRATINAQYDRQIQDLKKQLATEKNLTETARKAINESISSADKQRAKDLEKLDEDTAAKQLETTRQLEDQRTALIAGAADRQRAEINIRYDRDIEDLKKRLDTEKDLTEKQRAALNEMAVNYETQRNQELATLAAQGAQQRAAQELNALDLTLQEANDKIGKAIKRDKDGLINVDATRKNLAASNAALAEYVAGLEKYDKDLKDAHDQTLATLKAGTPEYVAEVQKYATAHEAVAQRIKKAQETQALNTAQSTHARAEYYRELFDQIAKYAQMGSDVVSKAADALNMGIQAQLDSLNTQLDSLNDRYEDAQQLQEDATKSVEDLEGRIQDATGGTSAALKEQLADQMAARNAAAREEQKLDKERQKAQAEIAKKEKQMKRNELLSNIAQAIAETAGGVAKAIGASPLTFGLPWSAFVAATGALEVGIMAKQLAKLADGGPIIGPSHAEGGVNIGLGYEAEGGEFVTNKHQYAANKNLVEFINASEGTITAADLAGIVPTDATAPVIITDAGQSSEERIVDAIENIDMRPVVAVTDILDVQDQVTEVRDLAGF